MERKQEDKKMKDTVKEFAPVIVLVSIFVVAVGMGTAALAAFEMIGYTGLVADVVAGFGTAFVTSATLGILWKRSTNRVVK